jgi:3-demethylubiquinone-9 3-methyltransferase
MQKISPFLWFNNNAEEAAQFYTSIFNNSRILSVMRFGGAGPGPKGAVMGVAFELEGREFKALNGGPVFTFTPAISLSRYSSTARLRRKSINCGPGSAMAANRSSAAGLKTNSVCRGRSCPWRSGKCFRTRTRRNRRESCAQ